MGKKKKKNLIDEDFIKAFRKANREIEMERNGGRWIAKDHTVTKRSITEKKNIKIMGILKISIILRLCILSKNKCL